MRVYLYTEKVSGVNCEGESGAADPKAAHSPTPREQTLILFQWRDFSNTLIEKNKHEQLETMTIQSTETTFKTNIVY